MPSDVRLEETAVVLEADHRVELRPADLVIDQPSRRQREGGLRRALVHDHDDGLTINFGEDYPGGVTIRGTVRIDLRNPARPAPIDPDAPGLGSVGPHVPALVVELEDVFSQLRDEGSAEASLGLVLRQLRSAVVELNERLKVLEGAA